MARDIVNEIRTPAAPSAEDMGWEESYWLVWRGGLAGTTSIMASLREAEVLGDVRDALSVYRDLVSRMDRDDYQVVVAYKLIKGFQLTPVRLEARDEVTGWHDSAYLTAQMQLRHDEYLALARARVLEVLRSGGEQSQARTVDADQLRAMGDGLPAVHTDEIGGEL